MMTIHKLTAGDGYTYLTRQVAGGDVQRERGQDAAEYYTAQGNPPGRWAGRGAPLLGLEGSQVSEEQMKALFGDGMHPDADAIISTYLTEHLRPDMSDRQLKALQAKALRATTLGAAFPEYKPIERFDTRVHQRLAVIEEETGRAPTPVEIKRVQAEEARRVRAAVAGFDVVFAPVKSAALLWALDPRPEVRRAVRQAHEAARDAALEMLEEHAAFTRTGKGGIAQIQTRGLIMAIFDHYDSRAGDPNPHTHVAISTKVQGVDGKWRSLDARALYRITVAVSEFYNTAFETELRGRIPVMFTERPDTIGTREPIREIAGVPVEFIEHFSSRRTEIEARYEQLLRQFRREHGHDPSRQICHQLARQANLDTREGKKAARSLAEMRSDWAQSLTDTFGPQALGRLMAAVPDGLPAAERTAETAVQATEVDVNGVAERVVANVAEMRSSWTVWNLRAEAERLVRSELDLTSPEHHRDIVTRIVAATLSAALSTRIEAPAVLQEPQMLQRSDGESVFVEHTSARYTSRLILDAEDRLVNAARTPTAVALAGSLVAASLEGFDAHGTSLDAGQRALVTCFATDNRLLVAGLGPAGTGKTTAMKAYAHVAAQAGQRILPLATSAAAAAILGRELSMRADNLHKFVHEYTAGPYAEQLRAGQPVPAQAAMFALHPGDVVLLDEAGMAGTLTLDRLVTIAAHRGAVVRLIGDYRQLGAVESGGALRLIATQAGAVELTTLYRFNNPAEADATLKLRIGDASGLDFYAAENRIRSGSKQAMIESAYAGWKRDMLAGKTTLMAAATGVNVTALAAQARLERVEAGQVEADGVQLHDGNVAGVGDWITTRHNDRTLQVRGGRDWVKNGDAWTILTRHSDGSLAVRHLEHAGTLVLPAAYVRENVELLYAATTNRAQGSTVDTAHPLITAEMSRENLYVIASRARHKTVLHVVTHELLPFDPDEQLDQVRNDARQYAAREILENVLAREGNELSATESIRDAAEHARSLAVWVPRYQHAAMLLAGERYTALARQVLARPLARALTGCDGWPAVVTALAHAEALGWLARYLLATTARHRNLLDAETPGRLLAWRINAHIQDRTPPDPLAQPSLADAARYADLLRPYAGERVLDPAEATRLPTVLAGPPHAHRGTGVSFEALATFACATATALGVPASQVTAHRAWPHLAAALAAADRAGRDVPGLLRSLTEATADPHRPQADDGVAPLARTLRRLLHADPATRPITVPQQLRHAATVTAALGIEAADRLRCERAWPALQAALHRAERDGHDPQAMLRRVADAREYASADSATQVLAWRLNRHLRTPSTSTSINAQRGQGDQPWRLVAWKLKALESDGADLAHVLDLSGTSTLDEILHHLQLGATTAPRSQTGPLPWLATTPADEPDHPITGYLDEVSTLIAERIQHLTDTAITTRPAWMEPLGTAPEDPAERAKWTRHIGVVAAYRDQHQITTDDPHQILGPYAEPSRSEHIAYWHAVNSIVTARHLARLEPPGGGRKHLDPDRAQLAVDLYRALADDERAAVNTVVAERCGQLWFSDRIAVDDDALLQPVHARALNEALVERGHLASSEPEPVRGIHSDDGRGAQQPTVQEGPLESELARRRKAQQDAERAARLERAQRARMRDEARRAKQRQRRVQPRRQQTQDPHAAPLLQPPNQEPTPRHERRFGG